MALLTLNTLVGELEPEIHLFENDPNDPRHMPKREVERFINNRIRSVGDISQTPDGRYQINLAEVSQIKDDWEAHKKANGFSLTYLTPSEMNEKFAPNATDQSATDHVAAFVTNNEKIRKASNGYYVFKKRDLTTIERQWDSYKQQQGIQLQEGIPFHDEKGIQRSLEADRKVAHKEFVREFINDLQHIYKINSNTAIPKDILPSAWDSFIAKKREELVTQLTMKADQIRGTPDIKKSVINTYVNAFLYHSTGRFQNIPRTQENFNKEWANHLEEKQGYAYKPVQRKGMMKLFKREKTITLRKTDDKEVNQRKFLEAAANGYKIKLAGYYPGVETLETAKQIINTNRSFNAKAPTQLNLPKLSSLKKHTYGELRTYFMAYSLGICSADKFGKGKPEETTAFKAYSHGAVKEYGGTNYRNKDANRPPMYDMGYASMDRCPDNYHLDPKTLPYHVDPELKDAYCIVPTPTFGRKPPYQTHGEIKIVSSQQQKNYDIQLSVGHPLGAPVELGTSRQSNVNQPRSYKNRR